MCRMEMIAVLLIAGSGVAPGRASGGQARGRRNVSPRDAAAAAKSLQSCPTLCDPIDGSPPGSAVPGILQARTRVDCHFFFQCMGEAQTVALRFKFGGSFPSGTSVASCLETVFSKENLPVCPLFQNWWGKEGQARTASLSQTCLPSSVPHAPCHTHWESSTDVP